MSALRAPSVLGVLILVSAATAGGVVFSSANTIPAHSGDYISFPQGVNDIKPPECTMILNGIAAGNGNVSGGVGNDLVLGGAGDDTLLGGVGEDCLLGGAGNDSLAGNAGADILLGGAGTDVCTGGPQVDTFPDGTCETATQ